MKLSELRNMENFLILNGYKRFEISRMTITKFLEIYNKKIREFR